MENPNVRKLIYVVTKSFEGKYLKDENGNIVNSICPKGWKLPAYYAAADVGRIYKVHKMNYYAPAIDYNDDTDYVFEKIFKYRRCL